MLATGLNWQGTYKNGAALYYPVLSTFTVRFLPVSQAGCHADDWSTYERSAAAAMVSAWSSLSGHRVEDCRERVVEHLVTDADFLYRHGYP